MDKLNEIIKLLKQVVAQLESISVNANESDLRFLLLSESWPKAIDPYLICDLNSEDDKLERATGILDSTISIDFDIKDKFLDFGCGEGHIIKVISPIIGKAIGYDLRKQWTEDSASRLLTDSFDIVKQHAPYNIVLLHDVLDHCENETPEQILIKIKSVLSKDGKIYCRCHPWISRHGSHVYHELNKAFVHLVFSEDELNKMLQNPVMKNQRVVFPVSRYDEIIKAAGLEKISQNIIHEDFEDFFKQPIISDAIIKNVGCNIFPHNQMKIQWVDFILTSQN